jgi:hypothetical protein
VEKRVVTWPGLAVLIVALFGSCWLYQRYQVNKAYGKVIVYQSLGVAMMGRQQVEAAVLSDGELPKNPEQIGFQPVDQPYGPSDRVVRLRLEMLSGGELKLHYNGWKFHDATLSLLPRIDGDTLRWKCTVAGIPADWIKEWCFQIEERGTKIGAPPPVQTAEQPASEPDPGQDPATWEPPFLSRGPLRSDAAVVAEGLRQLEPFQSSTLDYFRSHNQLPSSSSELEGMYPPEKREFDVSGHAARVSFGQNGGIFVALEGFSQPLTLEVSPSISSAPGNRLVWTCRAYGDPSALELPQECRAR